MPNCLRCHAFVNTSEWVDLCDGCELLRKQYMNQNQELKLEVGKTYVDNENAAHVINRQNGLEFFADESGTSWWSDGSPAGPWRQLVREAGTSEPVTTSAIPNADLIRAALDGKALQVKNRLTGWSDFDTASGAIAAMAMYPKGEYRLKPEPMKKYLAICRDAGGDLDLSLWTNESKAMDAASQGDSPGRVAGLAIDLDTLELIEARMKEMP